MMKSNMKSKIKCDTKKLNNKQVNRSASGITLIALIITIIVILILSGISIAMLARR